jgi:hypothetical protein
MWLQLLEYGGPEADRFKGLMSGEKNILGDLYTAWARVPEWTDVPGDLTPRFMPVIPSNNVTLDDYLNTLGIFEVPPTKEDALFFHHFFVTSCVMLVTGDPGYMVKRRSIDGSGVNWVRMKPKELSKSLARRTFPTLDAKGNVRDVGYDKFLMYHRINRDLATFQHVDFTDSENPNVFPMWTGHAHQVPRNVDNVFRDIGSDVVIHCPPGSVRYWHPGRQLIQKTSIL